MHFPKNLKKHTALFCAFILSCSGVFAQEESETRDWDDFDIFISAGYAADETTINKPGISYTSRQFMIGIEGMGFIKPFDAVGFGGLLSLGCGIGLTENIEMDTPFAGRVKGNDGSGLTWSYYVEVGPALALYAGDILRIETDFCFAFGYKRDNPYNYADEDFHFNYSTYVRSDFGGFSTGVQAKFFPYMNFSPIIGWRYTRGYSGHIEIENESYDSPSYNKTETYGCKYRFVRSTFYLGFSCSI